MVFLVRSVVSVSTQDFINLLRVYTLEAAYRLENTGRLIHQDDTIEVTIDGRVHQATIETIFGQGGHITQVCLRVHIDSVVSPLFVRLLRRLTAEGVTDFVVDQCYCEPDGEDLSGMQLLAAFNFPTP